MNRCISMMSVLFSSLLMTGVFMILGGCGCYEEHPDHAGKEGTVTISGSQDEHHEGEQGHTHAHTAPHGGTLVILGDHFAILEIVLDSSTGKMTAYVLDGEAEKPIRLSQASIGILVLKPDTPPAGQPDGDLLILNAVANALTGETVGDTSEFCITSDLLKGKEHFEGLIQSVTIKGEEKKGTAFRFPEGNE